MMQIAKTLERAKIVLNRERKELDPSSESGKALYVERDPHIHDAMITAAKSACDSESEDVFRWFFTGHMGAGKSTELNRIIHDPGISGRYMTHRYLVKDRLDVQNLQFEDLVLAIGQSVAKVAEERKIAISDELNARLNHWGSETELVTELGAEGSAKAGFRFSLLMVKAEAEVGAGGAKRKIVREKLFESLTEFIQLINDLCKEIEEKSGKRLLVVIDTLDHVNDKNIIEIFTQHLGSITRTRVSLLIVIPLRLLHEKEFMAVNGQKYSPLPNIKVFKKPGTSEIDAAGFGFCKEVIGKLADLSLFTEEALELIFQLSCGMIRDMIGVAGDACRYAYMENPDGKVELRHVSRVLDDTKAHFRRFLMKDDYVTLAAVKNEPHLKGMDGVGPLLHSKAVVYYPNGEGWFGLHPAVEAILNDS